MITEAKAYIDAEDFGVVLDLFRQRGLIPQVDEALARDGYQNIVVGICNPSLFGVPLTLVVRDE